MPERRCLCLRGRASLTALAVVALMLGWPDAPPRAAGSGGLSRQGEPAKALIRLGSELIAGVELAPGNWIVEPAGKPPYGRTRS